ncbi:MAG: MFS transporter [Chloroflexota bacterium]|nr:MFS transporter [Chloroflexota bacterium]
MAVYLGLEGALALLMALYGTVTTIYRVQAAGLNPLQLTLVGTALEGSIFLLQIPTGALADVFSRRRSVILGVALTGAGFLLEGLISRFGPILLAQVLWGAGYTFISGAEEAWISDEVGVERANRGFLRAQQVGMVAGLVGVGGSVALASWRLNAPLELAGLLALGLACVVALVMRESPRSHATAEGEASARLGDLRATLQRSWRLLLSRPTLLLILGIELFGGLSSEGFDRLGDAHFLLDTGLPRLGPFQPVVWFGVFSASILLLGLLATELARRRVDVNSHRVVARTLLVLTVVIIVGMVAFGLAGAFWFAAAMYLVVNVVRRVSNPLYTAWLNQHTEPATRATVLSLEGQADALGQIAGGPAVGAIGAAVSLPAALVVAGLALTPAVALIARTIHTPGAPEPAAAEADAEPAGEVGG